MLRWSTLGGSFEFCLDTIALVNDINGLDSKPPVRPRRNGFVFSTSEIRVAANRESVVYLSVAEPGAKSNLVQFAGTRDNDDRSARIPG